MQCYLEPNCVSYNFEKKEYANEKHRCDLNNATYEHDNEHAGDLVKHRYFVYRGAEVSMKLKIRRCSVHNVFGIFSRNSEEIDVKKIVVVHRGKVHYKITILRRLSSKFHANCAYFDTSMKFGTLKVVTNKFFPIYAKPKKICFHGNRILLKSMKLREMFVFPGL